MSIIELVPSGVMRLMGAFFDQQERRASPGQAPFARLFGRLKSRHHTISDAEKSNRLNRYFQNMGFPEL